MSQHKAILNGLTDSQRECPPPDTPTAALTAREKGVWETQLRKCHGNPSLVADVSQSANGCPRAVSGKCPTLTPGGKVFVAQVQRVICPHEAMLLHGFPMAAIEACQSAVSARHLKSLAGNAMHVESIGVMLALGLSMVNCDKLNAAPGPVSASESTPLAFLRMENDALAAHDDQADDDVHSAATTKAVSGSKAKPTITQKRPAGAYAMKTVSKAGLAMKKVTVDRVPKGKTALKKAVMKSAKPKPKAKAKCHNRRKLSLHYGKPSVFE